VLVAAPVGVPEIAPVALFNCSPPGSAPLFTAYVKPPAPPVAETLPLYAVPTVPLGNSDAPKTIAAGLAMPIVYATLLVSAGEPESVSFTVKLELAAAVGVPEMIPVPVPRDNPAGSDPVANDHVYGEIPPAPASVTAYAEPTVPPVSAPAAVEMPGATATVRLTVALLVVSLAEVAVTVAVKLVTGGAGAV
jgi:hypothetical protein